ncbi:alpha/beta fold hydrolase [Aquabacter sp. P-9]|uniref:alpha/beta fold hydrolase n=1 Tax=Aquabacter sediminis TaxID=3029197 RepID=UPI00237E1E33|nr:alpha/beta hydrolase [Aquabacter sp. P-9]MDE1566761.1 alpha/beta hydrolase [Aquabacter sp. P-9]
MTTQSTHPVTVVFVHGAWADGSSWRSVIARLIADGIDVVAVQNPTSSLADDVAATRATLAGVAGPVVLVGHSWGGTVITEAGNDPKVAALVYVAAFAPDVGQSTGDQVGAYPAPPGLSGISDDGTGRLRMSVESWIENVAQDLPADEARVLAAIAPPLGATTFGDKITSAAWKSRPNWYVVSRDDRAVDVALQRALAARMSARTTELSASHMALLSQPDAVAGVIKDAVASIAGGANSALNPVVS